MVVEVNILEDNEGFRNLIADISMPTKRRGIIKLYGHGKSIQLS